MFPFTTYIGECVEVLETSLYAAPTDAVLAGWARLQYTIDLSATTLGLRDQGIKMDMSDTRTQLNLKNCSKQLEHWKRNVPEAVINGDIFLPLL